jgi:hypothetical protein
MPVVQGTGRAEPLLAGAGLVGGFLAGGFVAGVGRVLLFQDPSPSRSRPWAWPSR